MMLIFIAIIYSLRYSTPITEKIHISLKLCNLNKIDANYSES